MGHGTISSFFLCEESGLHVSYKNCNDLQKGIVVFNIVTNWWSIYWREQNNPLLIRIKISFQKPGLHRQTQKAYCCETNWNAKMWNTCTYMFASYWSQILDQGLRWGFDKGPKTSFEFVLTDPTCQMNAQSMKLNNLLSIMIEYWFKFSTYLQVKLNELSTKSKSCFATSGREWQVCIQISNWNLRPVPAK